MPRCTGRAAEPGIRLAAEPDSEVVANAAAGSIFRSYNLIMDTVAEREDLEALVLLHQDSRSPTRTSARRSREALRNPGSASSGASAPSGYAG